MEGEDEGVAGGVGIVSFGFGQCEFVVVELTDELREEGPGLRVVGDEGSSLEADELAVSEGSMAEIKPKF